MSSQQFRAWRHRLGLTQPQAAEAIGIKPRSISYYEAGRPIPRYVELACAALALGITKYPSAAA